LSIGIYYTINHDDPPPVLDDFVDIFIPFSSRWSNLDLDLPQPQIERLVCNSSVSTPNLETLTLDIQEDIDPLTITQTAIRLQKITLLRGFMDPYFLGIPWSQLTEFRSTSEIGGEFLNCLEFLQLCPNLTRLSLGDIGDDPDRGHPLVMMPRLSWLKLESITWNFPINFGPLLDKLVVPSLREINFLVEEQWCKSELLSLIYRSSSPLEILNIVQSVEIVRADVDACFESIQTLREISVTNSISRVKRTYCRGIDQQGSELQIVVA
jgi:hypothetical protein